MNESNPVKLSDTDRVAVTLSSIAYLAVNASHEDRFRAFQKALQIKQLPTAGDWRLVWGPHEQDQTLVYVVQGPKVGLRSRYAVVFRGTVDSVYNFFEDIDVWSQSDLPWHDPEMPGARIADGTIDAWKLISKLAQGSGGQRQTLVDFLKRVDAGSHLIVTGHSLGGNMASALADWLRVALNLPKPHVTIQPITFAAPSAGNAAFAVPYADVFPNSKRYVNQLDLVPRSWAYADLTSIKSMYPGFGAPRCGLETMCIALTDAALEFVGHEYQQAGPALALESRLYSESGVLEFYDEALAQHSCLLYMYLLGIPLTAIRALYPDQHWSPPPNL